MAVGRVDTIRAPCRSRPPQIALAPVAARHFRRCCRSPRVRASRRPLRRLPCGRTRRPRRSQRSCRHSFFVVFGLGLIAVIGLIAALLGAGCARSRRRRSRRRNRRKRQEARSIAGTRALHRASSVIGGFAFSKTSSAEPSLDGVGKTSRSRTAQPAASSRTRRRQAAEGPVDQHPRQRSAVPLALRLPRRQGRKVEHLHLQRPRDPGRRHRDARLHLFRRRSTPGGYRSWVVRSPRCRATSTKSGFASTSPALYTGTRHSGQRHQLRQP